MREVVDFLKKNQVFYWATAEGDQPRVRPFGAASVFDGKLYFISNNEKDVFKQMQANPKVELCCCDPDGTWLRIAGTAVLGANDDAVTQMLKEYPNLKNMYAVGDGKVEVFYLKDAQATFYSFTSAPKTVAI